MSCTCQDSPASTGCRGSGSGGDLDHAVGIAPGFDADLPGHGPGSPAPAVPGPVASVNGVALHRADDAPDADTLRQRACTELLRQAALRAGLLAADDAPADDGTTSEAATQAIEALLEQALAVPDPSEDACRRHYEAHTARYRDGERVHLRHVLYAVTPGVDVQRLRERAEAELLQLRCAHDGGEAFARAARQWSNCPTGAEGGDLGWLARGDCAPEFAREVFGAQEVGVLPRLVHSRFGLHVVEVVARDAGRQRGYGEVREAVALALRQQSWVNALRQYLQVLAGEAALQGVDLDGADTPLVQ
ncbi:peptidylprolyl isomerase [Paracidovorax citrulli]|uniref:peptidylprolyl isomerase n=1 Tax=Paracidovorax citrulli TaxID=80869 RepID=UPI00066261A1|nr:peptidylprolyl isomerase [Paracidovorax citrulli]QCX11248.1 Chaperone SurA [Paracidovorax citrulli]UMT94961.1 peptidylprolyl isomerase [Paracidovorax citrulli]